MKLFYSEYRNDYTTYTFSYAVYALKEQQEEAPSIYAQGFLPYTGRLDIPADLFYLARSLRVNLAEFSLTSENRRVLRLSAELNIQIEVRRKEDFDITNSAFLDYCAHYAEERFSGGSMATERLAYVLERELLTHILTFRSTDRVLGYVFGVQVGEMFHYWYAFFDTALLQSHALGKAIMLHTLLWAKEFGLQYLYLGTCYTPKALYKVRDHKGCEFFDGVGWNNDISILKSLCANDLEPQENADLFKQKDHALQAKFTGLWEPQKIKSPPSE